MQTIEARAILSAADRTGGVFGAIASKIRAMTGAAQAANRATASTGAAAAAAGRNTKAAAAAAAAAGDRFGGASAAMVGMAGRVFAPAAVAAIGAKAYKNFADTDLAVRRIGITADASEEQVSKLSGTIRKLAFDTGLSNANVTKGLESLVAGGMDLPEALPALPAIAKTAQAAGAEVEDMSTTTLALNQNLGIATDKMQNAFDILVKGGKEGKFELKDMARYFPSIAPAAVAAGMKGEQGLMRIVAALQTIRAGTGTTEEAADSMLNIFAKMESEETTKKFKKFGIDLREEMKKARAGGKDLLETLIELSDKATGGDLSKVPQLFSDMQFARGMRALLSFRELNDKVMKSLQASAGSTQRDFEKIMNTPAIASARLKESFDRLFTSIGYGIDELGKKLGSKDGTSGFITRAAQSIEDIAAGKAPEKTRQYYMEELRKEELSKLSDEIGFRERFLDREYARRPDLQRPEFDKELSANRLKLFNLQTKDNIEKQLATMPPMFTDEEVKQWKDFMFPIDGEGVPFPRRDPRKKGPTDAEKAAIKTLPRPDPRETETPPVQPLDEGGSERPSASAVAEADLAAAGPKAAKRKGMPDVQPLESDTGAIKAAERAVAAAEAATAAASSVTASAAAGTKIEVTGEGEIKGQTEVKVMVEASSTLLQIVDGLKNLAAEMRGKMQMNGAGSTGKSSPDAAPGSVNTGMPLP